MTKDAFGVFRTTSLSRSSTNPGVLASERSEASESREEPRSAHVHESEALVSQQDRVAIL